MFFSKRVVRAVPVLAVAMALSVALVAYASKGDASGTPTASASASSGGQAVAQKIYAKYTKPVPFTVARLKKSPPRGKSVAEVNCTLPICVFGAMKGAVKKLGWKYIPVPFDISKGPAAYAAALDQALQKKPDYVINVGIFPNATVRPQLAAFRAAHIPMIQMIGHIDDPAFISCTNCDAYLGRVGELQADMMVAQLGTKAHILDPGDPSNVGTGQTDAGLFREMKRLGATPPKKFAISIGKSPDANAAAVIAELQRDPSIKAVATTFNDALITLPNALARAGLAGKVKFYGSSPKEAAIAFTKNGKMAGNIAIQSGAAWWQAIDGFARYSVHEHVLSDKESAAKGWYAMLTKSNADAIVKAGGGAPEPPHFQATYGKAWHR